MRTRPLLVRPSGRSVIVLGILLALIVGAAAAIVIQIYSRLDTAARLEHRVVDAQNRLGELQRIQLDEENGIRGYTATGQPFFLEPYRASRGAFERAQVGLDEAIGALGSTEQLARTLADVKRVHETWEMSVAGPLIREPHPRDALTQQTLGKILIDQFRSDTDRISRLLDERLLSTQAELRSTIDRSLFGGLATVVIFGVLGFGFVYSRGSMLATIDRGRVIVDTLQGAFRTDLDVIPGTTIGTAYLSATAEAAVGGDLYDIRRVDDRRGLVIVADVSGKGVEAAVNTAFVKYSIRTLAHEDARPASILTKFNRLFLETIRNPNLFVVTFVAIVDPASRTLVYASAGHSGAYLRRDGTVRALTPTGAIVGLDASFTYEESTVALEPGDILLLATDGLTEARDATGTVLDDVGAMALLAKAPREPQACADALVAAVRKRVGGEPSDDLAILAIGIDAAATGANAPAVG